MEKVGILLVNLGTPDDPSTGSVRVYLRQFLLDGRVIDIPYILRQILVRGIIAPFRARSSAKLYKQLWTENGSPLKYYGERVQKMLQDKVGDNFIVELGMRYQNPSIDSALEKLRDAKVDRIVVFPMFPQYASASTGSALQEVMDRVSKWLTIPAISFISSYHDNKEMISVYADNAKHMGLDNYEHFLFSFHGIPQRQLRKSDCNNYCLKNKDCCFSINENNKMCYSAQCYSTADAIAQQLGLDKSQYSVSFQSRLGKDPWTEPFTPDMLKILVDRGIKKLLVFSPSFVSDCLETTIEIDYEYKEEFEEMGGEHLDLVPSLNDDPKWVDAIEKILKPYL
jgi:ferrochelatase